MTPQQEWESLHARLDALREEVLLPGLDVRMRLLLAAAIGEPEDAHSHGNHIDMCDANGCRCGKCPCCCPPTGFYDVLNLHRPGDDGDWRRCLGCEQRWTDWDRCPEVARVRAVIEAAS